MKGPESHSMLNLWRDCWDVSQGSTPSSILPAGVGYPSDSQANSCYFCCGCSFGHLSRLELVPHCVLICILLRTRRVESIFSQMSWLFLGVCWRYLLGPFTQSVFIWFFLLLLNYRRICILWTLFPFQTWEYCLLLLCFLDDVLPSTNFLYWKSPVSLPPSPSPLYLVSSLKRFPLPMVSNFTTTFSSKSLEHQLLYGGCWSVLSTFLPTV